MNTLNPQNVESLFFECLFQDGENTDNAKIVQAVNMKVGFNPERLQANKPKIDELLKQIPEPFHQKQGGGWTFLNFCQDKDGGIWTGEHRTCDQLIALGIAVESVEITPKKLNMVMPGGMPYVTIRELV